MSWVNWIPVPKKGRLPIGGLTVSSILVGMMIGSMATFILDYGYYFKKEEFEKMKFETGLKDE
ncbi:hypothetical protein DPMN_109567 [Dreissena polymorpha]|uniref:Uncharacterized protein n=1 Tax=Dreissena polymorpha TaxID=45954 RepID=A0A9D4KAH7_DREPO|nr:hypothetical protein DPMN_109567 [Dreissena polymorpha]